MILAHMTDLPGENVDLFAGGMALLSVPVETVIESTFFEAPKVNDNIIGNNVKTDIIGLTRRSDGKKILMHDTFIPVECNCSDVTNTYRNPFTGETL